MIDLRKIQTRDNQVVAETIRQVFHEFNAPQTGTVYSDPSMDNLFELFQQEGAEFWVAELDGEVVGCCGIYPTPGLDEHCVELVKFYLAAKARGKGIGKALMRQSIASAKALGYKQVYIESISQFSKAVGMYQHLGFRKLDRPLGHSGHHSCTIWMLLEF